MKLNLLNAMLLTAMAAITSVHAADYKQNPFTLVYE
ncbi:TPA: alpha/beta hydrolase, partial [Yersinia enterocolitica]|nr:alpha/beta hydrolase [Yersinia enterocolitica]